jgi:molybdenum cofactor cytidylyltransferase
VGFSARVRDELLRLSGDSGAKAVLERHRDAIRLLESDDPGVLLDVDLKTDLARFA